MATEIQEYSQTEQALAELRGKYEKAVFDVTTTKGMEDARKARAELRTIRTTLEKKRVEIKESALTRCRLIDSEAKRITAELEKLEDPIDTQIKAEEKRKDDERAAKAKAAEEAARALATKLQEISNLPIGILGAAAEGLKLAIERAKSIDVEQFPEHARAEAARLKESSIAALVQMHTERVAADAEAARLAAERVELEQQRKQAAAEQAERDRVAREQREREEAEARAAREKIEAEQRAELKLQQDALDAERKRIAEEEAERRRCAEAERERLEADRREFERQREEAARVERERYEAAEREAARVRQLAEAAERQRLVDSADLLGSAREAFDLLVENGFADHIVTHKLAAALNREGAKSAAAKLQEAA